MANTDNINNTEEIEIPVYMFLGFLSSGKTTFIKDSLGDKRMNPKGTKTLLLVCEDGEEEYDAAALEKLGVYLEVIDSIDKLTSDRLAARFKRTGANRVFVEYNGMWNLGDFYEAMPDDWMIYQQTFFADASTFISYNANMRQLVFDKIQNSDVVIINRVPENADINPYHKLIRGVSRGIAIFYEYTNKKTMRDEIVDPLPFDINADIIKIKDRDFAIWFSDMNDNMKNYNGKTVEYLGMVVIQGRYAFRNYMAVGRHIMTCCQADIAYNGLACKGVNRDDYKTYDWVTVRGKISLEKCPLYDNTKGPVLTVLSIEKASQPEEAVATYY